MDVDSFKFGRREKVLIFVNSFIAEDLLRNVCAKYRSKISHDGSIADIENKKLDVVIVTDKDKFNKVASKYGLNLDRFFKIELHSINSSLFSILDKHFSLKINQKGLVELLNEYKTLENFIDHFPPDLIVVREEYKDNELVIKTVSYNEGKQIFHGITRDYRGETVVFSNISKTYHLLRGNLPVFEEYFTLTNVDDHGKILVTPKYDGSLLNITFIHRENNVFDLIKHKPLQKYFVNNGIVFIGTKNVLVTHDKIIMARFLKAIGMPVVSFVNNLLQGIKEKNNIVFHFELMASDEYGSQTVLYDDCFLVLLGLTHFSDSKKQFFLPKEVNTNAIEIREFKSKLEVVEYITDQHSRMLKGDLCVEPEGFVMYSNDSVFKYKFPEYFIAHRPSNHFDEALALSNKFNGNTRYFRLRVPIEPKIREVSELLSEVFHLKIDERYRFIDMNRRLIRTVNEEINKLKFSKKKKFQVSDYLTQHSRINPGHFKDYVIEFLKPGRSC